MKKQNSLNLIMLKRCIFFAVWLFASVSSGPLFAQEIIAGIFDDLNYFQTILEPNTCPTVALARDFCFRECIEHDLEIINHYYNTIGRTTEKEEWAFESYFANLHSSEYRNISPSFYLFWVRKKLPVSPKVSVVKIEESFEGTHQASQYVYVKLDNTNVIFQRHKSDNSRLLWGKIVLTRINGYPVYDLLTEDVKQGLMDSVAAEFWGSRETGYEFCGRKMPYRVIDGLPVIVEEDKNLSSGKNGRDEKKETN